MRTVWNAAMTVLLTSATAYAEAPHLPKEDVVAYYRALAREDEPAMLRAALRLTRFERGPMFRTVVGDLYWQGRGAAADPVEAVAWYRRAAVRGGELAMLALARAHYRGRGADPDPDAVRFWLLQAVSRSQPRAMLELSIYTRYGPVERRDDAADSLLARGIDRIYLATRFMAENSPDAMPGLRAAYVRAFRIFACPWAAPADYAQALRFLILAVEEGWSEGAPYLVRFGAAHPALASHCARD